MIFERVSLGRREGDVTGEGVDGPASSLEFTRGILSSGDMFVASRRRLGIVGICWLDVRDPTTRLGEVGFDGGGEVPLDILYSISPWMVLTGKRVVYCASMAMIVAGSAPDVTYTDYEAEIRTIQLLIGSETGVLPRLRGCFFRVWPAEMP